MVGLIDVAPACLHGIDRWVLYAGGMRYPDGGGLSPQGRARREQVRRQAAGWFAKGVPVPQIATRLRVSQTAVYGWRQQWQAGGEQALASKARRGAGVALMRPGCGALNKHWRKAPPCMASVLINAGLWPGCRT